MHIGPELFLLLPVFVLSVIVHECAHGLVALWNGDTTARDLGRLTLNPIPHIDPVGSLLVPGLLFLAHSPFLFGWAKPVPVNWANLRDPRNDQLKVALAGPASNLLLAVGFALLARLAPESGFLAPLRTMGVAGVVLNCALALFNLIPIPPLDGSWLVMRFLPAPAVAAIQNFRILGIALVVLLMSQRAISNAVLIAPLMSLVHGCFRLVGLAPAEAGL